MEANAQDFFNYNFHKTNKMSLTVYYKNDIFSIPKIQF